MTVSIHYKVARRVEGLPEGFEFQPNRFIYRKTKAGAYVSYKSQDGTVKQIKEQAPKSHLNLWLPSHEFVDCVVDFVPEDVYPEWEDLNVLGKCRLEYDPSTNNWHVNFIENPALNKILVPCSGRTQITAVRDAWQNFRDEHLVNNGHRWFKCAENGFQKISDQEAEKEKAHE